MIKNDREYRITQSRVAKFQQALDFLAEAREQGRFDVETIGLQESATKSMMQTLRKELKEYDELKLGKHTSKFRKHLDLTEALPLSLIKARIALNWTQKDLAKRVGTSETQIQRYESTDYESASLATIKRISEVMRQQLGH